MSDGNSETMTWTTTAELILLLFTSFMAMVLAINTQCDGVDFDQLQFGLYFLGVPLGVIGIVWCVLGTVFQELQVQALTRYSVYILFLASALYLGNWVGHAIMF